MLVEQSAELWYISILRSTCYVGNIVVYSTLYKVSHIYNICRNSAESVLMTFILNLNRDTSNMQINRPYVFHCRVEQIISRSHFEKLLDGTLCATRAILLFIETNFELKYVCYNYSLLTFSHKWISKPSFVNSIIFHISISHINNSYSKFFKRNYISI